MMRRRLIAVATRLEGAVTCPQGFTHLPGSAAAAAAGGKASAACCTAPLLGRFTAHSAAAAAQLQSQRGLAALLPAAARQAAAARPAAAAAVAAPCWRAPAGCRGYAQMGTRMPKSGYTPPVEMQRAMQMRLSMVSSNLLAEPYRGVPPPVPISAYFTLAGWKELWRRFMSNVKSLYALAQCRKHIPGFERVKFKGEALALYKEVCAQLAAGDKSALRQLVTPAVFSDMKRQLKQREDGGWARVHWELAREPTVDQLMTVQGRLILMDPKDKTSGFAQLTVAIPSSQRFAAFNRGGQLVAGSLDKEIEVQDFWVFEHSLKPSAANRWRLAGRLSLLEDQQQQQQQAGSTQQQPTQEGQQQQQRPEPAMRVGHAAEQQQQPQAAARPKRQAAARGRR